MNQERQARLREFAQRYTAAWCSHDASSVANLFSPSGSLTINGGPPALGREVIARYAQGFMTAFPDLVVMMDDLLDHGDKVIYKWTLAGTNNGPRGTGKGVRVTGFEEWQFGAGGLVAESHRYFDAAEFEHGIDGSVLPTVRRIGTTNYWVLPAILIIVVMVGIFLGGSLLHIFISNFW